MAFGKDHPNKGNKNAAGRETTPAQASGTRKKRRPRSELRIPLKKFQEDFEEAYNVLKDSLQGKDVEKERISTAKYMIDKMIALNSQAISDEMKKVQIRKTLDDGSQEDIEVPLGDEEDDKPKGAVFQLTVVDSKKD